MPKKKPQKTKCPFILVALTLDIFSEDKKDIMKIVNKYKKEKNWKQINKEEFEEGTRIVLSPSKPLTNNIIIQFISDIEEMSNFTDDNLDLEAEFYPDTHTSFSYGGFSEDDSNPLLVIRRFSDMLSMSIFNDDAIKLHNANPVETKKIIGDYIIHDERFCQIYYDEDGYYQPSFFQRIKDFFS